jgi:hypothetical protein
MAADASRVGDRAASAHSPIDVSAVGSHTALNILIWSLLILALVTLNEIALAELHAGRGASIGIENGPLEDAQLVLMVPALTLFWYAGLRGLGAVRVAGVLIALAGMLAFSRELDFKSFESPVAPTFDWLVVHHLQDAIFAVLGGAAALYLWLQRRYFWALVRLGLRWQAWPCAAALFLLSFAEFYLDGRPSTAGHFWEELVETNGYFLFAIAAWRHACLIGDPVLDAPL